MQFTFKRDEEGHERIYVGDVCVAQFYDAKDFKEWEFVASPIPFGLNVYHVHDAIERADEAGFWASPNDNNHRFNRTIVGKFDGNGLHPIRVEEVAVDVPVADNAVLSVTVGGDES